MIADEGWDVVGSGVPARFGRHRVEDGLSVDFKSFEPDILHFAFCIVAVDYRQVGSTAFVSDASEGDVFHTSARSCAVFLVESYFHLKEAALMNLFDAYVVEQYIAHQVVVATVDGKASLIINLRFTLTEYVDVLIYEILNCVSPF